MTMAEQGSVVFEIGGEEVLLLPSKTLYWPASRTLFVADLHLGKAGTFRAHAVPVPTGASRDTLDRLSGVLSETGASRLCILGDLWHAQAGRTEGALAQFADWRASHSPVEMILVEGNHDRKCQPLPSSLDISTVLSGASLEPFRLLHEPADTLEGYALAGHLHPGARLSGKGGQSLVLPCFWFGAHCGVLPAFGSFTGYARIRPNSSDSVFVVASSKVVRVSGAL